MPTTADFVGFLPPRWLDRNGQWRILAKVTVLDDNHHMVAEGPLDFTDSDEPPLPPDLARFAEAVHSRINWYLTNEGRPGHLVLAKLREEGPR